MEHFRIFCLLKTLKRRIPTSNSEPHHAELLEGVRHKSSHQQMQVILTAIHTHAIVYGISDKSETIKAPPPLMPLAAISFFSSEALSMLLPFLHAVIADE